MTRMVHIDGSQGEGGGQVVRTALALAAVTGRACRITAIRAGRQRPGLAAQHLAGVRGAALLCDGRVDGADRGSTELTFRPGELRGGEFHLDVGTAGAISLVAQVLVPMALHASASTRVTVTGGTDVSWSPPIDYLDRVYLEVLRRLGARVAVRVERRGFYPRGGGRVVLEFEPWSRCEPIEIVDSPTDPMLEVYSIATRELGRARVAERQLEGFERAWAECTGDRARVGDRCMSEPRPRSPRIVYVGAHNPGTVCFARLVGERCVLGASALGARGKRAEVVGQEAAVELSAAHASGAPLDRWMGDQIIPYLGLVGGTIRVAELTLHARTNMQLVERLLPVRFAVQGDEVTARRD